MNKISKEELLNKHIDKTPSNKAEKLMWTYELSFYKNNVKISYCKN